MEEEELEVVEEEEEEDHDDFNVDDDDNIEHDMAETLLPFLTKMASRGDMAHVLDQCVSRLKDRQTQLQERVFPENYIHTQQALEEHRDESLRVSRVKDKLEEIQESRGHTKDFANAESECLLTQDLQHQRTRCLETLLYVSEVENVFQNAQADLEERALYLSSRPKVFDSVYRGEDIEKQSKMHKDCVSALQRSWSWLQTLTQCMKTHVENTAGYHQFYHDVRHLEEDMTSWLMWLDSPTVKARVKTSDPDVMLKHFRLLVIRLLDYQDRVKRLAGLSREVHPIHYRKEVPDWPIKARSLVKYQHNEVSLEKDEIVTVLDNSDPERWRIQTSDNTETEVPAIVLVIPPPDPVCFQEINKLREQVYVNSRVTSARLKTQFLQFLSQVVQAIQPKELHGLSPAQKSDYLRLSNESAQLVSRLPADDPECNKLKNGLTHFRKLLSQIKPVGKQPLKNTAAQKLNKTTKLLQLCKEVQIYADHFHDESEKLRQEESFLITNLKFLPKYISKAYFQRVIPMIDIDVLTKETKVFKFKSDLYIYERNNPSNTSEQQIVPSKSVRTHAPASSSKLVNGHAGEDLVDGLGPGSLDNGQANSDISSPEVKEFTISGVLDPSTGKQLSVAKALAKGILNKEFGLYNNFETGESMPIAEAIARGFITVDYADPSSAKMVNGHGMHDGKDGLNSMEIKTFAISEVVDPKTGEIISAKEAIEAGLIDPKTGTFRNPVTGEEMSLLEAIRANYVIADPALLAALDQDNSPGAPGQGYTSCELEDVKYKISGVLDPSTGQIVSLEEAIQDGIIDADSGLYKNPVTGEVMPIEKAIEQGLINARPFNPKMDKESDDDILTVPQFRIKRMTFTAGEPGLLTSTKPDPEEVLLDELRGKTDIDQVTVGDPWNLDKQVPLEDAVEMGLVSLAEDSYNPGAVKKGKGPATSLKNAVDAGLITPEEVKKALRANNVRSPGHLNDMLDLFDPETGLVTDPKTGKTLPMKAAVNSGMVDPQKTFIFDQPSNKVMSVADAVREGILDADSFTSAPARGLESDMEDGVNGELLSSRSLPLVEACKAGYIEPPNLKEILGAYEAHTLSNPIDQGLFDPETGLVTDPNTGQMLTLKAAIEAGIIDPDMTFFFDLASNRVTSLALASKEGRLDEVSGKIIKLDGTGASMSVKDAIAAGEISPTIDPAKLAEKAESLALLRGCMDTGLKGFKVPGKNDMVSVEEAVMLGALLVPKAAYCDEDGVGTVSLPQAVQMERISPEAALQIFSALDKHSLEQEIANGSLDPRTGKFIDPATGRQVPIDQGESIGHNPDYIFLVDDETGNVTSLGALIEAGKFDPTSGKFISANSGKQMGLEDAMAEGMIVPRLEGERYIDTSQPLKDLVDSGQVNPRTADFVAANGLRMSLRDGLANGFLTLGSRVKVNPETGDVVLVSDEVVVQSLVEVKENSDWLVDIERALASHGKPSEKLNRLKMQAEECVGLREEIHRKESDIQSVVSQAEKLVQAQAQEKSEAKAPSNSATKDDSVQQFQKLKSSAADLKIRFDMVKNEAESRSGQIVTLGRNLEELYYHMEELDQWLDSAIEKCQDLQAAKLDIGRQHSTFKEFVEEVKDKEEDLAAIMKSTDSFKDHSQSLERDITEFRKRLHVLPTIRDEGESGVLDEELESIEAKFKDISRECAKQMDRLSSLVKCRKTFDDLNEKLSKAYPAIQEKLSALVSDELALDPQKGMQGLEALRSIKAEVIGQERKLKDLLSTGDRLLYDLEESGLPDEAEEIQALLSLRQEEHACLLADVTDHEQLLDAAVVRHQNALGRLGAIEDELHAAERALDASTGMSLDKDKLGQQLEAQRIVNAGLSTCKAQLERLQQEAAGNPDEEDKICDLLEQAKALEEMAEQRTQELEDLMSNIAEFESKAAALDGWLTDAIKILNPNGNAPKPNRSKVDGLHQAKKEKEADMQELREMCDHLIDGGSGDKDDVTNQYAAREMLAGVEGKWNDLTELLVQQVSLEALSEIDSMLKYLDKAESQINTAEPISIDPETLGVQLRDHKSFDEDLRNKRGAVKEIIDKCTHMLRETANSQTDEIKTRLNSISQQADIVCRLSAERLQQLESALPLAGHYGENQLEVSAWLEEMEAEIAAQGSPGDSLEQVKKQHDNLKMTQQIIEDHKLFIDDLNSTGIELMDVCSESDAVDIQNRLMDINKRYEGLKSTARSKARDLTDAKKKFTQEAVDTLDHLLEDLDGLHRTVSGADPIPASPDKLRNEIDENKAVLEDLDREKQAVAKAQEMLKNPKSYGIEDDEEVADFKEKVDEITEMTGNIRANAAARDKALCAALKLSEQFFDLSADVMSGLRDLRESLLNQEPPGIEPEGIKEQQAELAGQKKELEKARELVGDCKRLGSDLMAICGEPGLVEVKKAVEDLSHMTDDVNDAIRERGDELRKAYQHADKFSKLLESIDSWLPYNEHRQAEMKPISTNPDKLQDQVEELKAFKAEVHPHIVEMQQLNQELAALKDVSPIAAEALQRPVKQAMEKWAELLRGITDREAKLTEMQLKLGEVNQGMDDIITFLDGVQPALDAFDGVRGDPKCLEQHMRRLQLMQADVRNKEKAARKMNKVVDELLAASGDQEASSSPMEATREEMNEKLRATQAKGREKENKLQELMRQVKKYLGDLDDQLASLNEFRAELKTNKPFGALPETSEKQYAEFVEKCQALDDQERDIENLLSHGQDLVAACSPKDAMEVADKIKRLKERWTDTRDRARKRKEKLEEHLQNVSQFHETLKKFTDWLNSAEIGMRSFKHPSKLVDTITRQIDEHNALLKDIKSQEENVGLLDSTGTYLKYYGHKQDTVYVKNLLVGIRLRWKKLKRRADERARLLHGCWREDKRFDDSWRSLCDWLDESMQKLSKFLTPANQPAGMKQDIDELKKETVSCQAPHIACSQNEIFSHAEYLKSVVGNLVMPVIYQLNLEGNFIMAGIAYLL
ncbi:microtubule-actin cross-linking factor 1 [Plakobranchus ocellatus]|uniref:Microtubule-actin cross-linking factor 1 n=1 Tax=Plakobranchus ocellatus TaxID=259542 RepID=A0AAV3ZX64_9GAST|nr:microtubule-actin cross-linking factor 1 [Plakobranchus ocellatus]